MKEIRVEKRLPFGFRGLYGEVYKAVTYNIEVETSAVDYQNSRYLSLLDMVQFKEVNSKQTGIVQLVKNMPTDNKHMAVETTDSYFDDDKCDFECVVGCGDIIKLRGKYWIVEGMEEKRIYTPNKQSFYYCVLKNVDEEVKC